MKSSAKTWGLLASLIAVIVLGLGSLAGAGANLNKQTTGRISKLFTGVDNALILMSEKGITLEVMKIGHGCLIYLNGQRVSPEDLRVGLIATLHFNEYTKVAYKLEAVTPPYVLDGVIDRVDASDRRLKLAGVKQAITFDAHSLIFLDGKMVFANELKPGQGAVIRCAAVERNGIFDRIDKQDGKIFLRHQRASLSFEDGWNLFKDNNPIFITQLDKGDKISCRRNLYQAVRIDARAAPKKKEDKTEEKEPDMDKGKEKEKDKGDK